MTDVERRRHLRLVPDISKPGSSESIVTSWLSTYFPPEMQDHLRTHPNSLGSVEWGIIKRLRGIEAKLPEQTKAALRERARVVRAVFGVAAFPNMTRSAQEEWSQTAPEPEGISEDMITAARNDVRWLWSTFNLPIPSRNLWLREQDETFYGLLDLPQPKP